MIQIHLSWIAFTKVAPCRFGIFPVATTNSNCFQVGPPQKKQKTLGQGASLAARLEPGSLRRAKILTRRGDPDFAWHCGGER